MRLMKSKKYKPNVQDAPRNLKCKLCRRVSMSSTPLANWERLAHMPPLVFKIIAVVAAKWTAQDHDSDNEDTDNGD